MKVEKSRSTNPLDYQHLPQTIGAMSKDFSDGFIIPMHKHARDQLLYATSGVMRLQTAGDAWIVPHNGAVYIPAETQHSIRMHGAVEMRTLYIDAGDIDAGDTNAGDINAKNNSERSRTLCVVAISDLLRELIRALSEEPIRYDQNGRGGLIAQLIALEISRARELALNVPLPKDARLLWICAELLANPSDRRTLNAWSEVAGASTRTLNRLFKKDLGMSFNQWRQRIRFHSALEALSRGESVAHVAQLHGYHSTSAFSAAFVKVMGASPSKVAGLG